MAQLITLVLPVVQELGINRVDDLVVISRAMATNNDTARCLKKVNPSLDFVDQAKIFSVDVGLFSTGFTGFSRPISPALVRQIDRPLNCLHLTIPSFSVHHQSAKIRCELLG